MSQPENTHPQCGLEIDKLVLTTWSTNKSRWSFKFQKTPNPNNSNQTKDKIQKNIDQP